MSTDNVKDSGVSNSTTICNKELSVVYSERESAIDPSETDGDLAIDTLAAGKDLSNSRRKNRQEKKDIKAKEKTAKKGDAGGCCSGGSSCAIF